MKNAKKLIEVALPLEAINTASAREKSIRHGHPSTLHIWWARRPLAAARAVIFAQMVDDPSAYVEVLRADPKLHRKAETALKARLKLWEEARTSADQARNAGTPVVEPGPAPTLDELLADHERQRLFRIIEELVVWENTTNETVLQAARDEIWQSWRRACAENADHPRAKDLFDRKKLPGFHDPFSGGGALPLEAQRLGLESYASDLNPVAVLINKAMIEIPPKFVGKQPVNQEASIEKSLISREWTGAQGLAEDVRYYGQWMRDEAEKLIGYLYPKIEVTADLVNLRPDLKKYAGQKLTVIAYIWARTVKSPNPAFADVDVPLASTFMLSTKAGKEAYVEPIIEGNSYHFKVRLGKPQNFDEIKNGTKLSQGAFRCLLSNTPFRYTYIDDEANAGRMGVRLMAIAVAGVRSRVWLSPTPEMEAIAKCAQPAWKPDAPSRGTWASNAQGRCYGFNTFGDYFSPRQLTALTTFSDLVQEASKRVRRDAILAGFPNDGVMLSSGGSGATAYADAIGVYLACGVSRLANRLSTMCIWNRVGEKIEQVFAHNGISMTWDYAEANAFSDSTGGWSGSLGWVPEAMDALPLRGTGSALQADAATQTLSKGKLVSTDPPYYDNIGYADLSDFFYVWLRHALRPSFPDLFATLASPKKEELIASQYRHGGKKEAESFFLEGMTEAMQRISIHAHEAFPVTIYYAFKQSESNSEGTVNTGWDTFLAAVIKAGFSITGTWPMRTERDFGMKTGSNVLASSIILVCRNRAKDAATATRREFVSALKAELPSALSSLQRGNIAPVDLAQAAIGPGMAVFTRYAKVIDANGMPLTVHEALALINQTLDEVLAEQEGDFDADSRWALAWFEQHGFDEAEFGVADVLARAKNTSVQGLVDAGVVASSRGKVHLLKAEELLADWDPVTDPRLTAWEVVHHLIRVLDSSQGGGEPAAAVLLGKLGARAEPARELCYRLYTMCERKKRSKEALAYNGLVQSWPEIVRLAAEGSVPVRQVKQTRLIAEDEE